MRLRRIRVEDFRGIDACEVELAGRGVTVIEAPNESGKSSLIDAVDLLLHEKDRSKKRAVREAQPAGRDVGSYVEVELECGPVHLTCAKRFNKQPMTELTVHAPQREQHRGSEAHDRLRELLEAEVDLALLEALRFPQGRGLDGVALGDSSVIAARLDEVAGGHGEAGDDDLLARVRDEFERYYTPKGQEGKALKAVDADVARARERRDGLAERLRALEEDVTRLDEAQRELDRLRPERDRLERELANHRRDRERVRELRQRVADAETAVVRAEQAHTEADRRARERSAAVARLAELADELAALDERLAPRHQELGDLDERRRAAEAELAAAREAQAAAAERYRDAELALERARVAEERARRARQLARVDEIRERAARAEAFVASCACTDERLQAIREAEDRIRVAQRALEVGAPAIALTAETDLDARVDAAPHRIAAGESASWTVGDRLTLSVPGLAALTVTAGESGEQLRAQVDAAQQARDEACAAAGARDLDDAERTARTRREHEETLRRCDDELDAALDGIGPDELQDRCRQLAGRLAELDAQVADDAPPGIGDAQQRLERARDTLADEQRRVDERQSARDALGAELERRRGELMADQSRRDHLLGEHERCSDALARQREQDSDEALDEASAEAAKHLDERREQHTALADELAELDPDGVELLASNAERRAADLDETLHRLSQEVTARQARLEFTGEEGIGEALQLAETELVHAEREQRSVRARAAAARTLHEELLAAREEAYRSYRAPLRELIARQGRIVFGDDLDVELDEELKVVRRTLHGDTLDWEQLSSGAREQLAILSALAAARIAADDGVPLVLDDALGYSDPGRLERLGAVLGAVDDAQILVLTCVGDRYRHVGGATTVRLADARTERTAS